MGVKGKRSRVLEDEPTRLKEVSDIVDYAMENGFIENYQVNIEKIVEGNGIKLKKENNLPSSVSGYLKMIDDEWVIGVNTKHHPKRQRFTIAHEFAHYILHKDERGTFIDEEIYFRKSKDSSIEYNADRFAAEILMPQNIFLKAVKEEKITRIKDLSDRFNVSVMAIEMRAKDLNFKIKSNER